jgi:16S rRNA processing protein RimM
LTEPDRRERLVPLAEVARPHGVAGELRLKVYNRDSDLLSELERVVVRFPPGDKREEREVAVRHARPAGDAILIMLEGCVGRTEAERWRGAQLLAPRTAFPQLEEGEFYACDVEGARVEVAGEPFGEVERLVTYPTCDALLVRSPEGRFEVFLVEGSVDAIDVEAGVVRVSSREALEKA